MTVIKAITDIKQDRFKMGGAIYINREEEVDGESKERKVRDLITKKKSGEDLKAMHELDVKQRAREAFISITIGNDKTERNGSDEDVVKTMQTAKATNKNMFEGLNLVYGDEVIFLNASEGLNKDVGDIVDWAMLVTKDLDTGYNVGTLVPKQILEDFNKIKSTILPKTKDIIKGAEKWQKR